jgi:hypothetical protein
MRYDSIRVEFLKEGTLTDADTSTLNLTTQFAVVLRASMRLDMALLRPAWLNVLSGITA